MNTDEIKVLLEAIIEFKPAAAGIVEAIQQYGPEAKELFGGIVDGMCNLVTRAFANYIAAGFSREEALLLVISSKIGLKEAMDRANKNKS